MPPNKLMVLTYVDAPANQLRRQELEQSARDCLLETFCARQVRKGSLQLMHLYRDYYLHYICCTCFSALEFEPKPSPKLSGRVQAYKIPKTRPRPRQKIRPVHIKLPQARRSTAHNMFGAHTQSVLKSTSQQFRKD